MKRIYFGNQDVNLVFLFVAWNQQHACTKMVHSKAVQIGAMLVQRQRSESTQIALRVHDETYD